MTRKATKRANDSMIGANTTVTIGTAVAVVSGIVWFTYYASGIVRDVDGLKSTMATVQSTLSRIEYNTFKK